MKPGRIASPVWYVVFVCLMLVGTLNRLYANPLHGADPPDPNNPTNAKERIEVQFGTHKVVITCGKGKPGYPGDQRVCIHNTLSFIDADGKVFFPKQSKNFRQEFVVEKTPTGITCGKGSDGKYYVIVDFVAGPLSFGQGYVIDLFTEDGRCLTVNSVNFDRIIETLIIEFNKTIYIEECGK
ncbi:MAG: hypothetical protein FDX18_10555 [Chlorobium sp.]|nr:MAG: hypothetical protein FDX18_10555 [Chlorobium sp.]